MSLSVRMTDMIERKLMSCEETYGIKVLFWSFRGSLDINISRKNSDLDIVFVFKNRTGNRISAIHDIIGYGFDFWGWDIEDAVRTIEINNDSFYQNNVEYKNIPLTKEHARGGLTYYSGIYCYLGSEKSGSNLAEINILCDKLMGVMEKRVLISHVLAGVEKELDALEINGGMSACDYLYIIWRVLLAEHICKGGKPGESELDSLMPLYMDLETMDIVNRLRSIYKNSLSKHSQFFKIEELNIFICNKFNFLKKRSEVLAPQHEGDAKDKMEDLKMYIRELTI